MKNCIVSVLFCISNKNKIRPKKKKVERGKISFLPTEEEKTEQGKRSGTKWIAVCQEILFQKCLSIS